MKKPTLKISHQLLLLVAFVSVFIGLSIMSAAYLLSSKSRMNVLAGVTDNLLDLQYKTEQEFNKAQKIAGEGVIQASSSEVVQKLVSIYQDQQNKYYQVVKEEVGNVAENVSATLNEQNQATNETLDNLLAVSTDSMNRIMEFDNASLAMLSSMAVLNVNNFKTISAQGLKRLSERMRTLDGLLWSIQEDNLDELDALWEKVFFNYGPTFTADEKQSILTIQATFDQLRQNLEIQQRNIFDRFLDEFKLQSEIIAEEMRLLTGKVNFAINKEIENSTLIQDENIDKVITDLLLEKFEISNTISGSSVQVKETLNSLEEKLLTILKERGNVSQQNVSLQMRETKDRAEETRQVVSEQIRQNTKDALLKIDETIAESKVDIKQALLNSSKKTLLYSIIITSLCASVAVLVGFFIVRGITNPISNVLHFADKMAHGDFSERLPEGNDEMGEMGRALNVMADQFIKLQQATLDSFNQTLDQVIDCVYMFDPVSLKFIYVNQGACDQVAYSREELMGLTPLDIEPDFTEDSFQKILKPLQRGTLESQFFTTTHLSKTGKRMPVEVLLKYVTPPGNKPRYVAIVRDITEREHAKKEKERMQTQLLQAQKLESVGELAAGIAHEINTPTQFIGTNIEFLDEAHKDISAIIHSVQDIQKRAPDEISEEIDKCLVDGDWDYLQEEIPMAIKQSKEGVARVTSIVSAMKNFSHPGSREMTNNNLNSIIENTITVARNEWKYVADMQIKLDPELPLVPCLADEIGQVILNLLVNSVHAIKNTLAENPEKKKGEIGIASHRLDDRAVITIEDDGCGIPMKARSRIFDPFFTTKEVGKGTGQGLAISHDVITQKHGGTIDFQTETGVGTIFTITLPLRGNSEKESS